MEALKVHLKARFPDGHWEKLLEQDVPLGMLSALAWMHDQDAFYMDRRWQNTYLELADERAAVISLCQQIGYRLRPQTAASVSVRGYPQPVKPVQIVIPAGTLIPHKDTFFEFIEDATVPASAPFWPDETETEIIALTEGQTKQTIFTADGEDFQSYEIPFNSVIEGSLSVVISGETWEEVASLIYNEGDTLGRDVYVGSGLDSQTVQLTLFNAIIGVDEADKLTVLVDGVEWQYVETFTGGPQEFVVYQTAAGVTTVQFGLDASGAAPGDGSIIDVIYLITGAQKRYTLTFDENDRPTISFGDDENGKVVPDGSEITVTYRVGGGVIGNIEIGEIDTVVQGYLNAPPGTDPLTGETLPGETTEVRIFNPSKGSGGNKREAIDHARFYAPLFAKSNDRAVTRSDFEVLASTFFDARYGAAAYASAKLHQDKPEINQIDVAVWSRDATGRLSTSGDALNVAIQKHLQSRRTMCTYIEMVDGVTYHFDVYYAVSLRSGFFTTTVFSELQTATQNFFDSALVMPGRDIRINALFDAVNQVAGAYSVTIENIVGTILVEEAQTADGSTNTFEFLFENPLGQAIVPESLQITTGAQTVNDDGVGNIIGDIDSTGTNTIDYDTGKVNASFLDIPPANTNVRAEIRYEAELEWEEDHSADFAGLGALDAVTEYSPIIQRPPIGMAESQALDFFLPTYLMPVVPGRLYFISGFGAPAGSPFGNQLQAYDDGEGNIVGDVDPTATNTVDYRTGRVQMTWNQLSYPTATTPYTATLSPNADGVEVDFTFTTAGWPGPLGTAEGNIRASFNGYPGWGLEARNWDNWQGQLFGFYLDNRGDSLFDYTTGNGSLHFAQAPASPGVPPHTFSVYTTPITIVIYSAFVFSVKTPAAAGHDVYWFADNIGKIWGTTPDGYPTSRLDHRTGHYVGRLSSTPSTGRTIKVMYDAFLQSKARNIPIGSNAIGTFSRTIPRELEEEIDL
jgi:hypothetical protein